MKNTFIVKTSLFTLILALIAIGTFAFTAVMNKSNNDLPTKKLMTIWHYTGDTEAGVTSGSLWTQTDPGNPNCDPIEEDLPCQLEVDASVTNTAELEAYFQAEFNNNADQITLAAISRKPLP